MAPNDEIREAQALISGASGTAGYMKLNQWCPTQETFQAFCSDLAFVLGFAVPFKTSRDDAGGGGAPLTDAVDEEIEQ